MCAFKLTSALTNPQHVCAAVVPTTGEGVLAGECFFVTQNECFVAGVYVYLMQCRVGLGVDTACAHERECALNFACHIFVTLAFGALCNELLVPCVHAVQVGKTTFGKCAHQVECACCLVIRLYQTVRVRNAGIGVCVRTIHHVTAEHWQLNTINSFGVV